MWVDLSADLWLLILSFVETESLLNVLCVKFFKQITDRQQFWFERLAREFPEVCRKDWHGAKDSYKQALWFDRRDWRKICVEDVSLGDSRQINAEFETASVRYHMRKLHIITPVMHYRYLRGYVLAFTNDLHFFDFILNLESQIKKQSRKQPCINSVVITRRGRTVLRVKEKLAETEGTGRMVLRVCSYYCLKGIGQGLTWKIDQILN